MDGLGVTVLKFVLTSPRIFFTDIRTFLLILNLRIVFRSDGRPYWKAAEHESAQAFMLILN